MWQGRYRRWNPLPEVEGKVLWCEGVHDDWEGFRIWLRPEERKLPMLIVHFEYYLMYVNSDEGDRLSSVLEPEDFGFPHAFWKVEESALLSEFHRQSVAIREKVDITHFAFLSASDCIDVLALEAPTFSYDGKRS